MGKAQDFHLRLDSVDRDRLERLQDHYEMSAAQVLRMLLKRDSDAVNLLSVIAGSPKAKTSSKPKTKTKKQA